MSRPPRLGPAGMVKFWKVYDAATKKFEKNLSVCCEELVELEKTAILPDGVIKEVLDTFKPIDLSYNLTWARGFIANLAIHYVAEYA